jgi:hypothetical protein
MKVLIGCEFSGVVREAFRKKGHDAWSCDLLPSEDDSMYHFKCDVLELLSFPHRTQWDLAIFHPPCTYLCISGNKWMKPEFKERFPNRHHDRNEAIEFFRSLLDCNIPKICIENPVGVISSAIRKPDQYIQPYYFGDPHPKKTGLWLKNLPKLIPTKIVEPEFIIGKKDGKKYSKTHYMSISNKERWKERSRTFQGIAEAMALQWS